MPKPLAFNPIKRSLFLLLFSNVISTQVYASDTVCEVTLSNGGLVDTRSFPVTSGSTVLNGRSDGNPAPCNIFGIGGARVYYPSGLTFSSNGTETVFQSIDVEIRSGMTISDSGVGSGSVTFQADLDTDISGPVSIRDDGTLRFITHNKQSSNTRLRLQDAYIDIESGSELQIEYKLGDTTGEEIDVGALSGAGSLRLQNVGSISRGGRIAILNGNGLDYSYTGDITYENQSAPSISKSGTGSFSFTGDIINASGVLAGFNDGFDFIEVNAGTLTLTSNSFILGTDVQINGGQLVLDQDVAGAIPGASFSGIGGLYKRGTGNLTLGGISRSFRGNVVIEEGVLGLSGGANLSDANNIDIRAGATLDVSNVFNTTSLSRLKGNGTLALGDKNVRNIIRINPGDSIGVLNVTGTGDLNLGGTLLEFEMDPTQAPGDSPGVTHDQLAVAGSVSASSIPVLKLIDVQNGSSPSAFLNGREFTIATAGSGLSNVDPNLIFEDSSFHAFVGADPNTAIVTDTEVKVKFGIKTAQQVATTIATTTATTTGGNTTAGSKINKTNAAKQIIQQTTGLTGNQAPTQAQLTSAPALQSLTNQALASAASNNNPEAYSSNLSVNLEYADFVGNLVMDRAAGRGVAIRGLDKGYVEENALWANIEYVDGQVDGKQDETGSFDYELYSFLIGKDFKNEKAYKLGMFVGAGSSKMDEHDHIDQEIEGDLFHSGIYTSHQRPNGYVFSTILMAFYGQYDSERRNLNTDGSFGPVSNSDFDLFGITTGFKFSKTISIENTSWAITPSSGFAFSYLRQGSLDEENGGAGFDYQIESADADSLVFNAGIDASYEVGKSSQHAERSVLIDLRTRYEYDVMADRDSTHDIKAGLIAQNKDTFVGQNRGAHGMIVGAGIISQMSSKLDIGLGVEYAARSDGSDSSIGFDLNYQL